MEYAGRDATAGFEGTNHSLDAMKIRQEYYIGEVQQKSSMAMVIIALVIAILGAVLYFGIL